MAVVGKLVPMLLPLLLCNKIRARTTGSEEDIVMVDLATKIEKVGKVIMSEEEVLISVFIQMPNISNIANERKFGNTFNKMNEKCIQSDSNNQVTWNNYKQYFNKEAEMYLNDRLELLSQYLTPLLNNTNKRSKRNIFSFLAGGALTLLMGGITEAQIYNINKHVQRNSEKIEILKEALIKQHMQMMQFENEIVTFVHKIMNRFEYLFFEQSCTSFYRAVALKMRHDFSDWTTAINDLLWTALQGENSLLLTPRMIKLQMIHRIIEQNEVLQNTVFQLEPSYLYSLARLTLIELDRHLSYAHFILMVPMIMKNSEINLFKSTQVGSYIDNGFCIYNKYPEYMYKVNDTFQPLHLNNCRRHNKLYVCPAENFSNETACIQENVNSCDQLKLKCKKHYSFAMSEVGILIRNNRDNNSYAVDSEGWMNSVKLSRFRTAYLYWKDVQYVQVGNKRIASPNMKHIPLKMSNLTLDIPSFINYIDGENVTSMFRDMCEKYNSSLNDIITPVIVDWHDESNRAVKINTVTMVTLILIVAMGAWMIYLHIVVHKSNFCRTNKPQHASTEYVQIRRSSI